MITHDPFIFTRLLSKRIVSCELPLLAILCWLTFALTHHTDFDPDKVAQVAGAVNFLDGRGLVVFNIDEHPTPHLQAHPIIGWPPLFSLVYAGLYALIGNHWYTSQTQPF